MPDSSAAPPHGPRPPARPGELGYRWPAEWEPHAATWLSWPHNPETWPGKFEPVPAEFARFVRILAEHEPVQILAGGDAVRADAEKHVGQVPNVTLHDIATNDAWVRDYGPTFIVHPQQGKTALVHWRYNAWGGKYPPFDRDVQVPNKIGQYLNCDTLDVDILLEGGAIEGNGLGTIMTTASCVLNPNRNPGLTRETIEDYLRAYLGARKVLWVPRGELAGDDTDGHIDQLARFVGPRTVVAATTEDASDENYEPLQENLRALRQMTDQDGQPLEVVPLPLPQPVWFADQRLPASYCNFLIVNSAVLVPEFGDPADERACAILAELCPHHAIRRVPSRDLVLGLGSLHCLSQQQPQP